MAPIQGCAVADGNQHVLKAASCLTMIVDVAGGDCPQTGVCREARERRHTAGIAEDEIVLEFDRDIVRAEPLDVAIEEVAGVTPAAIIDQARERATPASGKQDQSLSVFREQGGIETGLSLLVFFPHLARWREGGEAALRGDIWTGVGSGDEPAEVGVPRDGLREESEMGAIGQGQLGADDGCDTSRPRSSRELHGAVEPVVIRDGQSPVAEVGGLTNDLLWQGRAIEEGECGVEMELDVRRVMGDG